MRVQHCFAILVLLAWSSFLQADQPSVTATLTTPAAQAGQNADVTGSGLSAVMTVVLRSKGKKDIQADIIAATRTDTKLSFTVSADTAAGTYTVVLTPPGSPIAPELTVTAAPAPTPPPAATPAPPTPVIDSVFPTAPIPVGNRFDFVINGSNFSTKPDGNTVNVEGQGDIPFQDNRAGPGGCKGLKLPCLEAASDGRSLSVFGFERRYAYQGPIRVRVLVKNGGPSDFKSFTLSRVNHRIIVWLTFVVFALLMYIVYSLVARGIQPYVIAGKKYPPLAAFLLDKETESYSLSKFQLLALSLVLFFGYIYVFLCRVLVQWNFDFPDVPQNYPTLLALSAGTTVFAAGLGSVRGTKGAGPVQPSWSDLISNGGMVLADRFQFFVWTLIACAGFISLILMQDPASVQKLPMFPDGLLYVMGVSSAGYLGGKAARNPGPVLKEVQAQASGDNLAVTLLGSNLDKKAKFRIDAAEQSPALSSTGEPIITGIAQAGAPTDYCTQLKFVLVRAASLAAGDHTFEIVNADGLAAQALFTGKAMEITPLKEGVPAGTSPVGVELEIKNFRDGSVARWQAPGTDKTQDLPKPQFDKAANKVTVSLIPGAQVGAGTLTFQTPVGATETCQVEVKAHELSITTGGTLTPGKVNSPYSQVQLAASGGTTPYKWSLTTGKLPDGLNLDPAGGITGTPTAAGSFKFTLQVSDAAAKTKPQEFTIVVA